MIILLLLLITQFIIALDNNSQTSNNWQVFRTDDGRIYYYNKITGNSRWSIPTEHHNNNTRRPRKPHNFRSMKDQSCNRNADLSKLNITTIKNNSSSIILDENFPQDKVFCSSLDSIDNKVNNSIRYFNSTVSNSRIGCCINASSHCNEEITRLTKRIHATDKQYAHQIEQTRTTQVRHTDNNSCSGTVKNKLTANHLFYKASHDDYMNLTKFISSARDILNTSTVRKVFNRWRKGEFLRSLYTKPYLNHTKPYLNHIKNITEFSSMVLIAGQLNNFSALAVNVTVDKTIGATAEIWNLRNKTEALSFSLLQQRRYVKQLLSCSSDISHPTTGNVTSDYGSHSSRLIVHRAHQQKLKVDAWDNERQKLYVKINQNEVDLRRLMNDYCDLANENEQLRNEKNSIDQRQKMMTGWLLISNIHAAHTEEMLRNSLLKQEELESNQRNFKIKIQDLSNRNFELLQQLSETQEYRAIINSNHSHLQYVLRNMTIQLSLYANRSSIGKLPLLGWRRYQSCNNDQRKGNYELISSLSQATAARQPLSREKVNKLLQLYLTSNASNSYNVTIESDKRVINSDGIIRKFLAPVISGCLVVIAVGVTLYVT